jgi:hypothetical protein
MDLKQSIPESGKFKLAIKQGTITAAVEEMQRSFLTAAQLAPSLSAYFKTEQNLAQAALEINKDWHSRFLEATEGVKALMAAGNSWKQYIELQRPFEMFHELDRINAGIRASFDAVSLINSLSRQDAFIRLYTEGIKMSDLSRITAPIRAAVLRIHDVFSPTFDAFSGVRDALFKTKDYFSELRIPAREHFLTTDLLHTLTVIEETDQFEEERAIAIKDTDEQMLMTMQEALAALNPDLYRLWRGAWDSLASNNADRTRHTLVSARELVTHVLHALSPDDLVRKWSKAKEHYHNGRPTRKARLHFIYSGINDLVMRDYLQKEIDASLSLVELFQDGTHNVMPPFSDAQLRVILRRVHSMICTLVEINKRGTSS